MKTLIVYDSRFGNTRRVADAIGRALGGEVRQVEGVDASRIKVDLLVVGSPTHGGRPTEGVSKFLKELPDLHNVRVAAFDTRVAQQDQTRSLRLVMKVIGYAAGKIASKLRRRGGTLVSSEGFIVEDKGGPLRAGELTRATHWAGSLK